MRLRALGVVLLGWALASALTACAFRDGGDADGPAPAATRTEARSPKPTQGGVALDERWPSRAELRWLDRYARWEPALYRSAERVFAALDHGERDAARSGARAFVRCARRLPAGTPPSPRLATFAGHVRDTCAAMGRAVRIATGTGAYGTGNRKRRVDFEVEQAGRALDAAHGMLPLGARRTLPIRGGRTDTSRIEPHLSRAASEVGEVEAEVRCWSKGDWNRLIAQSIRLGHGGRNVLGFVVAPGGSRIHLSPELCAALVLTVYGEPRGAAAEVRAGEALLALAHEAQHSAGVADEAKATCYALQTVTELAYALKLRKPLIERLVAGYWRHRDQLPAEYRSAECREGGKLDLTPGDGAWP